MALNWRTRISLFALAVAASCLSVESQSTCQAATESKDACVDDLVYLRCRLQEELDLLNVSEKPLFADGGKESCEVFVDKGFCVSQPTEMSAYCCKTFTRSCLNGDDASLPTPPEENFTELFDKPTETVSQQDLCQFVTDIAEFGIVAGDAMKKNFGFLLDTPPPSDNSTEDTLGGEIREGGQVIMFDPPAEWNSEAVLSPPANARLEEKKPRRGRQLQGAEETAEVVVDDAEKTVDARNSTDTGNSTETISSTNPSDESTNLRAPVTEEEEYEEDDPLGLLGMLGPGASDFLIGMFPDLDVESLNYSQLESGVIVYGGELARQLADCDDCLVPLVTKVFDGAYREESPAKLTASQRKKLDSKNDAALIQLTAGELSRHLISVFGNLTEELKKERETEDKEIDMDLFLSHAINALRRVIKQDSIGGIMQNLLPVAGIVANNVNDDKGDISTEANHIYKDVLKCSGEPIFTNEPVVESPENSRLGNALEDTVNVEEPANVTVVVEGGEKPVEEKPEGETEDVTPKEDKEEKEEEEEKKEMKEEKEEEEKEEKKEEEKKEEDEEVAEEKVEEAPKKEETPAPQDEERLLSSVEGLVGEQFLVESVFQLNDNERLLQENPESPKDLNFISDTSERDANEKNQHPEVLEGQPCIDHPSSFVSSMHDIYGNLSCNDLITAVGCQPDRFVVPFRDLVLGCRHTWFNRCAQEVDVDSDIEAILDDAHCSGATTPSPETKGAANSIAVWNVAALFVWFLL